MNSLYNINNDLVKNVVIYTFSDLKEELEKLVNVKNILCIDKGEYTKANDHKIYIYPNSIYEKSDKVIKLRFKILSSYMETRNIWISNNIEMYVGLIKVLKKSRNENFYISNRKNIEDARKLIENKEVYDDIVFSIESGNTDILQKHKSKYSQYNHPNIKAEENDIIVDGRNIWF